MAIQEKYTDKPAIQGTKKNNTNKRTAKTQAPWPFTGNKHKKYTNQE